MQEFPLCRVFPRWAKHASDIEHLRPSVGRESTTAPPSPDKRMANIGATSIWDAGTYRGLSPPRTTAAYRKLP